MHTMLSLSVLYKDSFFLLLQMNMWTRIKHLIIILKFVNGK